MRAIHGNNISYLYNKLCMYKTNEITRLHGNVSIKLNRQKGNDDV